jgi:peptidyl-prolyl isomerase E (cyclophilin E)
MDMNELRGRILKVSLARPMKGVPRRLATEQVSQCPFVCDVFLNTPHLVWESEEWLKQYAKPLSGSGGEEDLQLHKQLIDMSLRLAGPERCPG